VTVNHRIYTAKVILELLREKPRRWTELEKLTVKASPTFSSFRNTLIWLHKNGYVERVSRGLYSITDKGQTFLKAV